MILKQFINIINSDAASPWQLGFQDPATPVMEGIINFHNDLMFFIILVAIFVTFLLGRCLYFFDEEKHPVSVPIIHGQTIEIIWTVIPAIILMFVAVPSFSLLYSVDEIIEPEITIKIIGHQWYWSYEYSYLQGDEATLEEDNNLNFDSYMIPEDELEMGHLRLLEVDERIFVPIKTHVRLIITSGDVLHSWAVPSFGIKLDACPGRLNQTSLYVKREGVYYGQCSEICGINHGFMPIVVEAVSFDKYMEWFSSKI
jgi:cytochrome c oxidase subunit 2